MSRTRLALAIAGIGGAGYLVARHGRTATAKALGADADFGKDVAASLSFTDALAAGARALVGKNPLGTQATATTTAPITGAQTKYGWLALL